MKRESFLLMIFPNPDIHSVPYSGLSIFSHILRHSGKLSKMQRILLCYFFHSKGR